jgi:hypothetical protein
MAPEAFCVPRAFGTLLRPVLHALVAIRSFDEEQVVIYRTW